MTLVTRMSWKQLIQQLLRDFMETGYGIQQSLLLLGSLGRYLIKNNLFSNGATYLLIYHNCHYLHLQGWKSGAVTTLGRGGSDLTATTIGKALGLREIQVYV
jgi:hypothetical protein